jgi:peptidoglycan/xylan/chitin deacetylase (PgdA/CDA1 family)
MAWLAAHGYQAVTLERVWAAWHGRATLPAEPVVLTFDDGYPGDLRVALPTLRSLGWPGVLNLHVGNLVPARVRELVDAGWEVDAHTLTHPDLTTVSPRRLRREVAGSRAWIRRMFGVRAAFFCYPAGRWDAAVWKEVRRAGFRAAEGERYGLARRGQRRSLDRIEILASDGVDGFVRKLLAAR